MINEMNNYKVGFKPTAQGLLAALPEGECDAFIAIVDRKATGLTPIHIFLPQQLLKETIDKLIAMYSPEAILVAPIIFKYLVPLWEKPQEVTEPLVQP